MNINRTMVVDTLEQMCDLMCGKPGEDEHEFCLRCGRKLKTEEARRMGYGPVCKKKLEHHTNKRLF